MDIKKRIKELCEQIEINNKRYYEDDNPFLDDSEYDMLVSELRGLETKYPEYKNPNSPINYVGGFAADKFSKVKHKNPMLSLANAFNINDLKNFYTQISKITNDNFSFFVEPKIDGLSISLIYSNGKLIKAVTRGDGNTGEDVTENIFQIKSIPKFILDKSEYLEVRGEVYLSKNDFKKINHEKFLNREKLFANPRNAASGTLRQLDSEIVAKRNLSCWIYYYFGNRNFTTHSDSLDYLKSLGFMVNSLSSKANNINDIFLKIETFSKIRNELEYEIDGVVIKVDQLNLYEKIGYTSKVPKWAIAFKFPAEVKITKLLDIVPTIGRTGRVTYNAVLEPVIIAGTTIRSATLHNAEFIISRDIRINSAVKIKKAGDIIPEVIGSIVDNEFFKLPIFEKETQCPICNSCLEIFDGEVDQYCNNENCQGKLIKKLEHFVSRAAMNIEGLSEKIILKLYDKNLIREIYDFYDLYKHRDEIITLDKMGDKLVSNLLNAIEVSKSNSAELLLFGLGIRHIGKKMSDTLLSIFNNIDNLFKASFEELVEISDIGPMGAISIKSWCSVKSNIQLYEKLKERGLNIVYSKMKQKNNNVNIASKKIVITGSLSKPRKYFEDLIKRNSGIIMSSITSKTDFLLCGLNAGNKLNKAKNLNVKVLEENDFLSLVEEENENN
ncbi:NAD-dependent DNA ligase LigA [Spiroplasma endosymbiont of Aspidapion aeneum]|uniref:NAD-dependent DNA ligase LigA n=1 Tax=Spiroplasma endosymbiont of Aspidapion aeneum TaxID=3066276 RepID=UPI00313BF7ED